MEIFKQFNTFLESLKGSGHDDLIETLKKGCKVCYESNEPEDKYYKDNATYNERFAHEDALNDGDEFDNSKNYENDSPTTIGEEIEEIISQHNSLYPNLPLKCTVQEFVNSKELQDEIDWYNDKVINLYKGFSDKFWDMFKDKVDWTNVTDKTFNGVKRTDEFWKKFQPIVDREYKAMNADRAYSRSEQSGYGLG